jgi:hypothetical protein
MASAKKKTRVTGKVFFVERWPFRSRLMTECLKKPGKMPAMKDNAVLMTLVKC